MGEESDSLPGDMVLDPITGAMVPNPEHSPDRELLSTPPSFEDSFEPKSNRPKFKSKTPSKPKTNK